MHELLTATIDAHGGLERWNELDAVSARLLQDGVEWALKGQAGVLADVFVRAELHQQRVSHHPFGAPDRDCPSGVRGTLDEPVLVSIDPSEIAFT